MLKCVGILFHLLTRPNKNNLYSIIIVIVLNCNWEKLWMYIPMLGMYVNVDLECLLLLAIPNQSGMCWQKTVFISWMRPVSVSCNYRRSTDVPWVIFIFIWIPVSYCYWFYFQISYHYSNGVSKNHNYSINWPMTNTGTYPSSFQSALSKISY